MTPTQIARRSNALYADGTCGMTRRVLCDMVAQRESDLEDVMAENRKLRELVRDFYPFASGRAAKTWLIVRRDRMRELGVEVDE